MSLLLLSRIHRISQIYQKTFVTMAPPDKKALVLLATGAEEMEAVIAIDVLRRGGIEVQVAGVPDANLIHCSRGVNIKPDISIHEAPTNGPYDVMVLPGGLGGSQALAESKQVGRMLQDQEKAGRLIAAICAAPIALKCHGVGIGKNVTSYPSFEAELKASGKYQYKQEEVVIDDNLITSRGPATAFRFALAIVHKLVGKEKAEEIAQAMLITH